MFYVEKENQTHDEDIENLTFTQATHQAIQNQNKLTDNCSGTSYKARSRNTSYAYLDVWPCVHHKAQLHN